MPMSEGPSGEQMGETASDDASDVALRLGDEDLSATRFPAGAVAA